MIATRVASKASLHTILAVALTAVALLTTGCAGFNNIITPDTVQMTGEGIQGRVHGGQFPITGATVQLWAAGASGYGSAPSALGSSVTTGTGGTFTLGSYVCPSASTQTYITSSSGNPGLSGNNTSILLAAPLGDCGNLSGSTYIVINEVTTAATAVALGQFFVPANDHMGTSSTNSVGLANAFITASNLVDVATGTAVTSASQGTVTITPEAAKLNTIANVLAACVNSDGSGTSPCATTLFPDVTPTSGTAPTDTLQAAVYMSQNPTSNNSNTSPTNLTALYGLQSGTSPFSGVGSQPTDWTVGILYTDNTTLNDPQNVAADHAGNIWVLNHNGGTSASLTELSPSGNPVVNVSTINSVAMAALNPRNEAVDTNGNVWITSSSGSGYIFKYDVSAPSSSIAFADGRSPYGIAIDGSNNVFVTKESSSTSYSVEEFLGDSLASTAQVQYAVYNPSAVQQPEYAALDTNIDLWMTNGSAASGLETNIFQMSSYNGGTSGVCTVFPCNVASDSSLAETYTNMVSASGSVPTLDEPWGIAAGPGAVVWTANEVTKTVTEMTSTTSGTDYGSATSLNKPQYVAIDGAANVWVTDSSTSPGGVTEICGSSACTTGTILSPVNSGGSFTAIGFSHAGLVTSEGITLDASGNVWVANNVATTGGVFELVGAATPTDSPIAKSFADGLVGVEP